VVLHVLLHNNNNNHWPTLKNQVKSRWTLKHRAVLQTVGTTIFLLHAASLMYRMDVSVYYLICSNED